MSYILQVTGQRDWKDKAAIFTTLDKELARWRSRLELLGVNGSLEGEDGRFIVRHGVASGADSLCNDWAMAAGVVVQRFRANWNDPITGQLNPSAGPIRNREMGSATPRANKWVAFWDGKLRKARTGREYSGTLDMITVMLGLGVTGYIVPPSPGNL